MIVTVEIDLTKDVLSMDNARINCGVQLRMALSQISDDDTQLMLVGQHLWNASKFIDVVQYHCGDDLYAFEQTETLLFTFRTSKENAILFKIACHAPEAVAIIEPRKIKARLRFD